MASILDNRQYQMLEANMVYLQNKAEACRAKLLNKKFCEYKLAHAVTWREIAQLGVDTYQHYPRLRSLDSLKQDVKTAQAAVEFWTGELATCEALTS